MACVSYKVMCCQVYRQDPLQSAQMVDGNAHRGASTKSGIHVIKIHRIKGSSYMVANGHVSSLLKDRDIRVQAAGQISWLMRHDV